eukprot:365466-Chlamydomonas_euryale.AAC.8
MKHMFYHATWNQRKAAAEECALARFICSIRSCSSRNEGGGKQKKVMNGQREQCTESAPPCQFLQLKGKPPALATKDAAAKAKVAKNSQRHAADMSEDEC